MGDGVTREAYEALRRENAELRLRVAELQRAAARHEETDGVSLVEREELLRDAERVSHFGTWTWDLASGRVTWSDELHRILGLEPGSITPSVEAYMARVHPEDRARAQAAAEESASAGTLSAVSFRVVRPDGTIRHTRASTAMLFDTAGTVRRAVGCILDQTESLEAEAKLRRALGLLEEAQRFAQLGSWRFDPSSGELEWSQEFRRIAGLPADVEARAELFFERVVPEDRERFQTSHPEGSALQSGEIDGRLQRPDGKIRHVRVTYFPAAGRDGREELRGTMLDVTDQVRMREELAHAQKMEAVGRLAAGIAHDFNNLLTVVIGNLDLLTAREGLAPEVDNSLQALSSASNLTRRLLAFGRKAQLSLKLVSPNALVRSMTSLMQRLVGDEVRLAVDLAPELPMVRLDPLEMERALVNLVVNARDAMPGGGTVYIATGVQEVAGVLQVELSVGDEGPGIDEAVRAQMFEPFFTTRESSGGTGLGLATVLGTAEQHGGTVRVDAREGGGTRFTIVLPAAERDKVAKVARQPAPRGWRRELPPPALQLLVIDDETKVADVTRLNLEAHGHVVHATSLPEQALQIWAERGESIDLVICDIAMAGMRGPELVSRMSELGARPRVLFITGYSEEAVQATLGHPVLTKPFTSDALLAAIVEAISEPDG